MTEDQLQKLIDGLKPRKNTGKDTPTIVDMLFKFSTTILMGMSVWLLQTTNSIENKQVEQGVQISHMREDSDETKATIAKLQDFTSEPRFTQKNFEQQMKPLLDAVTVLTSEVADLKSDEKRVSLDIQRLQTDVEELKRKQ